MLARVGQVLADAAGMVVVEVVAQLRLVGEPQLALGALMHAHAVSVTPSAARAKAVARAVPRREGGPVIVRRALDADAAAVRAVHLAAFNSPGGAPAPEARLAGDLRAAGDLVEALSFVAVHGDAVVGSVVTSAARLGSRRVVAVGPLGVVPAWQRRGAGTALMHAVLGAADALGEPCVALLGSPAYYGRFGFEPAARYGVVAPDPAWGEHFMLRRLTAWEPGLGGAFRYAAAFDGL